MTNFDIRLRPSQSGEAGAPGAIAITAAGLSLTRLQRFEAILPDNFVSIPLARFGFWLADNWWRLRYEARPRGPNIRAGNQLMSA
jgi:hypothetical protein